MGERADDVMARHPDVDDDAEVFVEDTTAADTTAHADVDAADDVDATRAQIEQTRAEMSDTIDAIKEKLNPDVLVQQAKDSVREATIGRAQEAVGHAMDTARVAVHSASDRARETGATMWDTIKQNPMPIALTGVGLGWLYMNARKQPHYSVQRYHEYRYNNPTSAYPSGSTASGTYPSTTYTAGSPMPGPYPSAPSMGPAYSGAASTHMGQEEEHQEGVMERAQEKAGEIAGRVQETASHLGHQAQHHAGRAGSAIQDLITENPLPAALAGVSLAWLYLSARNRTPHADYPYRYDYSTSVGMPAGGQTEYGSESSSGGMVDSARERVGEVAGNAREKVGEVAGSAREKVGEVAGRVQERVSGLSTTARYQASRAGDWYQRTLQENPLVLAAAMAGVGLLVGLTIPNTPPENRLMGDTKERLMDRAKDAAQDVAQKVQTVAHEAINTAKEEARDQGLAPQSGTLTTTPVAGTTTAVPDRDLTVDLEDEEIVTDVSTRGSGSSSNI